MLKATSKEVAFFIQLLKHIYAKLNSFFRFAQKNPEGYRSKTPWKPVRLYRPVFFIPNPSLKQAWLGLEYKKKPAFYAGF